VAEYRAAIASTEDACALNELYPAEWARRAPLLDEVDRADLSAAGNSSEQLSATRAKIRAALRLLKSKAPGQKRKRPDEM
jgi:hypothetical protein